MLHYNQALKEIGKTFSKDEINFLEIKEAIDEFKKIVTEISNLDLEDELHKQCIYLTNGKALGTTWAAMCLDDIIRTKMFIKGIFKAIKKLQKQNKPIHIVYAGTGPYATLLLPALATFSPEEIKVTLIEINTESFNYMKKIIEKLGFEKHVISFENEDATTIKIKNPGNVDMIVSETLQCGLIKEQQIPITINLLKQVPKKTVLIPEMLALDVCLLNFEKFKSNSLITNENTYGHFLGRLIEINNTANEKYNLQSDAKESQILENKQFQIPQEKKQDFDAVALITRITVFENEKINLNESGLTLPILLNKHKDLSQLNTFTLSYKIDKVPGFTIEWH
ncbi:conserved hypothetical protein [Flavobacterium sp. 9AF]|uniref:class I SAM-dependent methyltransferase n=1 Tax=Flavobacterium sp. 9AF TaxID=2653142 RepID=UPI0012F43664|nr:class I SAM-dependent methyltransferase [Flavobacterium sp. 9AF]VXB70676.1 conserved hypothetical protein [Flavobacterium sp. 9AF]